MNDKQIKNILLKLLTENCSTEKALLLLKGTEGIKAMIANGNFTIKENTHFSDFINVKCPLKAFGEIIENHEDAITDRNIEEFGNKGEIKTLHDAFKMNAKQAGVKIDSVRYLESNLSPIGGKSPYGKWKGDRKVHLIFGNFDKKNLTRNILSMDSGIGLTHTDAQNIFMYSVGKSIKKNRNYSRGVLGVGESACLKHCFLRVTATRKKGASDMTLCLSIYIKDSSLVENLDDYNPNCYPVLQLVDQSGSFFKVTSEDLKHKFGGDYLKFENDDQFELSNIPLAPTTFDYGFVNRFVGYHMPNVKGYDQIGSFPETNFNKFLNAKNELTACPVITHEANPTTRASSSKTGTSILLKGFNVQFDSWYNNLSNTSVHLTAKFASNGIGNPQSFPTLVEVLFKKDNKCKLTSGMHTVIRGKVCHYDDLLLKELRKKVNRPLTKAEKDVLKKMVVRIDLNEIPSNLNSSLLTGDKGQISHDNAILEDLLSQLQIVFKTDEFKLALEEEEKILKENSSKSANHRKVENEVFRILNIPQTDLARISDSSILTTSKKTPPIPLLEEPTFLHLNKVNHKLDKTTKHSTIAFKTNGEKAFFLDEQGSCSEGINLSITYNNKDLFTGAIYNHGCLRLQYDASFITKNLSVGEEVKVNWYISKKGGCSYSDCFKLEVIAESTNSKSNTQSKSQGNSKELRAGAGNQPIAKATNARFEFLDEKSYNKKVLSFLGEEEFEKALKEQFPNLCDHIYLKRHPYYFMMKYDDSTYSVLVNQDALSDDILNDELCNDEISAILAKNSVRICSHENILLSDNYDLLFYLEERRKKGARCKNPKLSTT
jgi:hypothetical protein